MGYYLQIDSVPMQPLASNTGYGDVIRWSDSLPPAKAGCIHHLTTHGWEQDLPDLRAELELCMKEHTPTRPDAQDTLTNLLRMLNEHPDAHCVTVTDGVSVGDGKPTEDDE